MPSKLRRVVTGHDANGKAVIKFDDTSELVARPNGVAGRVLWTTESFPVDNTGD